MIVVTDCHVGPENGNAAEFREMLARLEKNRDDLVFLGDVFDLWIALPAYEQEMHAAFAAWCGRQKTFRSIGLIEGNHEFYVAEERGGSFSWCSTESWRGPGPCLLVHGDRIDRRDRGYRFLRRSSKSPLVKAVLRRCPWLGRRLVAAAKRRLDAKAETRLPREEIRVFAEREFGRGTRTILTGHFHREYAYAGPDGCSLHVLPAWLGSGIVTRFDPAPGQVRCCHWTEL